MKKWIFFISVLFLLPSGVLARISSCSQPSTLNPQFAEAISDIVVTARHEDDPCGIRNLQEKLFPNDQGAWVSYRAEKDKSHRPGEACPGHLAVGACFLKRADIYAEPGAAKYRLDRDNGGIVVELNNGGDCVTDSCYFPVGSKSLQLLVPFENMFDTQLRESAIYRCEPEDCYTISIGVRSSGYGRPQGPHVITVTRTPEGDLDVKMYVNNSLSLHPSRISRDGLVGGSYAFEMNQDLKGKSADVFASCEEPHPRSIPSSRN